MEYLWIIAIIAGCVVSSFRLSVGSKFDEILVVVRSLKFLKRSEFDIYYSIVDGQWLRVRNPSFIPIHMIYLRDDGFVDSYEEYVALCKDARPRIYDIFRHYLVHAIKDVALRVLPVIFLPSLLFWLYWYFYLIGAVVYFLYMLATDTLGWFIRADEVINRSQDALLLTAFKKYLETK